jgi:hypothetical protein
LYGIAFNPQTGFTTGYQALGGIIEDNPSCAAPIDGTGQVICAVKGPDSALYGIAFNPRTGFKTGYLYLGGTIEDSPSCASPNNTGVGGQVICGVKARDSALYGIQFDPRTGFATGYQYLGGTLQDRPSCAVGNSGSNVTVCAVKGTDNALYGIGFSPVSGFTTGYIALGGTIEDNFSCASPYNGTGVICAVKGTDSALYGIRFDPAAKFSTGFAGYSGSIQGNPSCAYANDANSTGTIICAVKGTDSSLYGIAIKQ